MQKAIQTPPEILGQAICGLYAIADTAIIQQSGRRLTDAVKAVLAGGVRVIQYRDKTGDRPTRLSQALELKQLCNRHDAILIINDDVELAVEVQAQGVHIGKGDTTLEHARQNLGQDKLIGVSCYNDLGRAQDLVNKGADYVAFGSAYASQTKPGAVSAPLELFVQARQSLVVPVVAIGGITLHNATPLVKAGVNAVAVISDLFLDGDVETRAAAYQELFK